MDKQFEDLYHAASRVIHNIPKPKKDGVARESWEALEKAFMAVQELIRKDL